MTRIGKDVMTLAYGSRANCATTVTLRQNPNHRCGNILPLSRMLVTTSMTKAKHFLACSQHSPEVLVSRGVTQLAGSQTAERTRTRISQTPINRQIPSQAFH